MSTYDPSKIGKLYAWGGEHIVYDYGEDKVIKFSTLYYLLGRHALGKAVKDYTLCRKYLGEYILDTDIQMSANGRHIVHVQPKIKGRALKHRDLENEEVQKQFSELMRRYNAMVAAEGYRIDLIGREGVFNGGLTNIFVTDSNALRIIDATVLELSVSTWVAPLFYFFKQIVIWRQKVNLRKF